MTDAVFSGVQPMRVRLPSPNIVIISLLLLIVSVSVFSIVQDISRQTMYLPMCQKYRWVLAQSGPFNMPRCLNIETGHFVVPPEMYYSYIGKPMPAGAKFNIEGDARDR